MGIILKNIGKEVASINEKKWILQNIDLTIEDGEMVAIVGKSGAGKSTLLHIIGSVDKKTEGNYYLDEQDMDNLKDRKIAQLRNVKFGYIMQDFGLLNEDSVYENIVLPYLLGKTRKKNIKERAYENMKLLGIDTMAEQKVEQLSGGEKQRTAIARALMMNPKYILADEPTGALDTANTQQVMKLLKDLQKLGKTIIIVTHDQDVANYCDRKICLSDGHIIEDTRENFS